MLLKFKIILLLILLYLAPTSFSYYQDVLINNSVVEKGERSCVPTYEFVKKFLLNYTRDFTVLDLGAAQGFFSLKIGYEFPNSTCVMIEGDYDYHNHTDKLLELCLKNNSLSNIIFLKNLVTPELLHSLSECEHFDLILALNFIHHCGNDWKSIMEKIFNLGDYVIIENPPVPEISDDEKIKRQDIEDFIMQHNGTLLGKVPRHTTSLYTSNVYLIKTNKSNLIKRNILWPPPYDIPIKDKFYYIKSDFSKKELIKTCDSNSITTPWHKGINLLTFKLLHGVFPLENMIIHAIDKHLSTFNIHKDLTPANIIVQGKEIQVIDLEDFHYKDFILSQTVLEARNQEALELINKFLNVYESKEVYSYYWQNFLKL